MKITYIITIGLFLGWCGSLSAQNRQISGMVTATDAKTGIPYASISIKGTNFGTAADKDGKYDLSLPAVGKYVFWVRAMGFEQQEWTIEVKKDTVVNFVLQADRLNMEEVVITGTRTPKMLKDVPVPTRIIPSKDIQNADVVNVKDILETELSGMEFTSHGGSTNINMQGMSGKYILFLLDGERIAGETRDNVDYNRLDATNIERIEIVKGSASALYGSSAIGGVVNIITKDAQQPWQVSLHSRYGSHAQQQYGGNIGFKKGKFNSLTSANFKYFKGYMLKDAEGIDYLFENEIITDTAKYSTEVKGYKDFSVHQKFTYQPVNQLKLTLKGGFYQHEDLGLASNNKRNDFYLGGNTSLRGDWQMTKKQSLQWNYNFDIYSKFDRFLTEEMAGVKRNTYQNTQHTANVLFHQYFTDNNILTVGAEFAGDFLLTYQFKDTGVEKSYNFVVFAQHDILLWKKFNLVYGLRLDYNTAFNPNISPKVSMMYKLKDFTFRVSYGGGFRAPSLKELYTDWDHQGMFRLVGNKNLKPEKSHNCSLSAEYTRNILNISLLGYYNYIKDQITSIWNQKEDTAFYVNHGKAQTAGMELNARIETAFGLSVKYSYSYTYTYSLDDMGVNINSTRPHTATLQVGYRFKKGIYEIQPLIQGRVLSSLEMKGYSADRNEYYTITYPAYTLWKFILNQHFFKALSLQLGIENIFDYKAKHQTFNSSLTPGRTYFAGLNIEIDKLFHLKYKKYKKL
ncbi:MAG: TonB-dependent receptor [Bacteroidales bacterium]|jgi:outer membrane receptor for ferrienterochelin and colicins|nr:TonB-dependent receptor [Bacteroidales bacterium]